MDINTLGAAIAVAKSIPGTAAQRAEAAQAAAEAVAESIPQDYSTLSEDVQDLKSAISQAGGGLSNEAKQALLALLEKVAYVDDDGQDYYDALESALYPPADLSSISAVFTQGQNVIYDTDSLDTLKQYLVVTAHYSDSTTETIVSYTLSGTLAEGSSTITVTYREKTATFNVTVTANSALYPLPDVDNSVLKITNGNHVVVNHTGSNGWHIDLSRGTYADFADGVNNKSEVFNIPSGSHVVYTVDMTSFIGNNGTWASNTKIANSSTGGNFGTGNKSTAEKVVVEKTLSSAESVGAVFIYFNKASVTAEFTISLYVDGERWI